VRGVVRGVVGSQRILMDVDKADFSGLLPLIVHCRSRALFPYDFRTEIQEWLVSQRTPLSSRGLRGQGLRNGASPIGQSCRPAARLAIGVLAREGGGLSDFAMTRGCSIMAPLALLI